MTREGFYKVRGCNVFTRSTVLVIVLSPALLPQTAFRHGNYYPYRNKHLSPPVVWLTKLWIISCLPLLYWWLLLRNVPKPLFYLNNYFRQPKKSMTQSFFEIGKRFPSLQFCYISIKNRDLSSKSFQFKLRQTKQKLFCYNI